MTAVRYSHAIASRERIRSRSIPWASASGFGGEARRSVRGRGRGGEKGGFVRLQRCLNPSRDATTAESKPSSVSGSQEFLDVLPSQSSSPPRSVASSFELEVERLGSDGQASSSQSGREKDSMTVCAVDMGTNSFHMVIAKADARGKSIAVIEQMKEEVRVLGGSEGFNVIMDEQEVKAISVLKRIQNIATTKNCDQIRLVATSAVREARNSNSFIRHVQESTGLEVEVISGQEEARLVYLGAMQAVPIRKKEVLLIDIGGGSTEILYGRKGKPEFAISLQLGHLRLFEQCIGSIGGNGLIAPETVQECRSRIQVLLNETGIKADLAQLIETWSQAGRAGSKGIDLAVGCSGTIERAQAMIAAKKLKNGREQALEAGQQMNEERDLDESYREGASKQQQVQLFDLNKETPREQQKQVEALHVMQEDLADKEFTIQELKDLLQDIVQCKTRKERASLPGMNMKRVDLIVTGALILEGIMDYLELDAMVVSPFALREGIIFDTLSTSIPNFKAAPDIRRDSVMHLATRFDTENRLKSAKHSAKLAKQLLTSLREGVRPPAVLARLDKRSEFLLEAAILLHSVGIFVNHSRHHKHAYYIIKNSEILLGFMPMEIEILAVLALHHRKKYPNAKKPQLAKLPKDVQKQIILMTAIMRICIALDRRNTASAIESIQVLQDEETDSCILVATPGMDGQGAIHDVSFEIWAVKQELAFFSKVLKRDFSIVEGDRIEYGAKTVDSFISS